MAILGSKSNFWGFQNICDISDQNFSKNFVKKILHRRFLSDFSSWRLKMTARCHYDFLQIATLHNYQWLFFTNCSLLCQSLTVFSLFATRCTCLPLFFHWLQLVLLVCNSFLMSTARCAYLPLYILHNCQCTLTFQAIEWFALIAGHFFH